MEFQNNQEVPWRLHTSLDVEQVRRDLPALTEISVWLREYLAKPHPDLGRPGPVCPFIPRALQLSTVWMAVARLEVPNAEQMKNIIAGYREVFLRLEPVTGEDALNKSIIIIFPDVSTEDAPGLIDQVQKDLKPFFVEEGMMIGEFHKLNPSPGLHNPNFYPLRSPIPMLAMRYMVDSDLVFLMREIDVPETRVKFLKSFLQRFVDKIPEKKLGMAREALAQAELEILERGVQYA